jgi:hypothetical protein
MILLACLAASRQDLLPTIQLGAVCRADDEVRIAVIVPAYDRDERTVRHARLPRLGGGIAGTAGLRHNALIAKAL